VRKDGERSTFSSGRLPPVLSSHRARRGACTTSAAGVALLAADSDDSNWPSVKSPHRARSTEPPRPGAAPFGDHRIDHQEKQVPLRPSKR